MPEPKDVCLQCKQSREEVKRKNTICGTVSGYEYQELEDEWPRHHWRDWSNTELSAIGIKPEFFDLYRRYDAFSLTYAACEHTVRGHNPVTGADADTWGMKTGECWSCGKKNVGSV